MSLSVCAEVGSALLTFDTVDSRRVDAVYSVTTRWSIIVEQHVSLTIVDTCSGQLSRVQRCLSQSINTPPSKPSPSFWSHCQYITRTSSSRLTSENSLRDKSISLQFANDYMPHPKAPERYLREMRFDQRNHRVLSHLNPERGKAKGK